MFSTNTWIFAAALILIVSASIIFNLLVLITFRYIKRPLTFREILFVSIAISDLLQALFGYSIEIITTGLGYWSFGILMCQMIGFMVTFLGLVSINHLALLAIDRYLTVCHPRKMEKIHKSKTNAVFFALLGWIYALIWAIFPIVGWSNYALERGKTRCSVNWKSESVSSKAYVVCLFIFNFVSHIIILIFCYYKIHKSLRRLANLEMQTHREASGLRIDPRAEKTYTSIVFAMIFSFLIAWVPYSVISMWTTFAPNYVLPIFLELSAALLAKSSTVFNPIIYVFYYKNFRKELSRLCLENCCGVDENEIIPTEIRERRDEAEIT